MPRYSEEEKLSALAALQANNWNYTDTSKQIDIPVDTLERWAADNTNFKHLLRESEDVVVKKLSLDIADKAAGTKARFLEMAYETKVTTIARIQDVIPDAENLRDLSQLLKILHEITDGSTDKSKQGGQGNFFQFVEKQLVNVTGGKDAT